jgi:hypothetical protein
MRTLFRDIYNNSKIPIGRNIRSNFTDKKICFFYSLDYIRMLYISYGSVGELGTLKKASAEKSLKNP